MSREFSRVRSEAIRSMLVDAVELAPHRTPSYRARSFLAAAGLVAVGLVVGGAVSAAAVTVGLGSHAAVEQLSGVAAPAGVIPGTPIIALLGVPESQRVTGSAQLALADAPTGATHVRVTVSCLTPGTTTWGFENPASSRCVSADMSGILTSYSDFPLVAGKLLTIEADATVSSMVTVQFLSFVETAWGVNAHGESFGAAKGDETPDLLYAVGRTASGSEVAGYIRTSDLDEATGSTVPLYASDGTTQRGVFHPDR